MSRQPKEASIAHVAGLLVRNRAYGEAALAGRGTIDAGENAIAGRVLLREEPSPGSWKNSSLRLQAEAGHPGGALGGWEYAQANVKLEL